MVESQSQLFMTIICEYICFFNINIKTTSPSNGIHVDVCQTCSVGFRPARQLGKAALESEGLFCSRHICSDEMGPELVSC